MTETFTLSEADISQLVYFVKKKQRVDFTDYATSSFKRRLVRILMLFKLDSLRELIKRVVLMTAFFNTFLEEITVNTTEMFQIQVLGDQFRSKLSPFAKIIKASIFGMLDVPQEKRFPLFNYP